MKSFLPAIALLMATFSAVSAQTSNGIPLPGRATDEMRYSADEPLLNSTQSYYFYNPDSTLNHEVEDAWDEFGNTWVHDRQYFYGNYPDGRLQEYLMQQIQPNGTWVSQFRRLNTYYPDPAYLEGGFKTSENQNWNGVTGQWEISFVQNNYAYGPGTGQLEGTLSQGTYDSYEQGVKQYGGVTNYFREVTPGGVRVAATDQAYYDAALGINEYDNKEAYVYNAAESLEYDTLYRTYWIADSNAWAPRPDSRTIQTITGGTRVQLGQQWNGAQWVNSGRSTSITDNNNLFLSYISEQWDEITAMFVESFRVDLTYNPDHSTDVISIYNLDFSDPAAGLFLTERITYEYGTSFVGTDAPVASAGVKLFPNPTAGFVQVTMDNPTAQSIKYTLLDTKGKVCAQTRTSESTASFSLQDQPAGLYLLRVEKDGAIQVIPIVKQ